MLLWPVPVPVPVPRVCARCHICFLFLLLSNAQNWYSIIPCSSTPRHLFKYIQNDVTLDLSLIRIWLQSETFTWFFFSNGYFPINEEHFCFLYVEIFLDAQIRRANRKMFSTIFPVFIAVEETTVAFVVILMNARNAQITGMKTICVHIPIMVKAWIMIAQCYVRKWVRTLAHAHTHHYSFIHSFISTNTH